MTKKYEQFREMVERASKVLVVAHRHPDADTLGAVIATRIWLKRIGKDVVMASADVPDKVFRFLPYLDEFVSEFDLRKFDLMIVLDAGASYMTNFEQKYENFLNSGIPIVNIDHHGSNDDYGNLNIVDPSASSTTLMIYRIFKYLDVEIDEDIATCLLAGIYGDTGGFMHSNTNAEVYEVSSILLQFGAKIAAISSALFKSRDLATLRLWGRVLEKVKVTKDKAVVVVLKPEDYEAAHSDPSKLPGIVDYLCMIPDTKYAMLLHEDRRGNLKGSLRTRCEDVDVSRIAAKFGGGGHPKASGFIMNGKVEEEFSYRIVSADLSKKSLDF